MATLHYTATVRDNRLLELPEEADELGLKPGDQVHLSLEPLPLSQKAAPAPETESGQRKPLRGLGLFKGKLGGTQALFESKQEEIEREERRF